MPMPADKIINTSSQPRRPLVHAHRNFKSPSLAEGSGIGVSGKADRRVSKKRKRAFIGSDSTLKAIDRKRDTKIDVILHKNKENNNLLF